MGEEIKAMVRDIYEAIDDKKGEDTVILNISGLSVIADYFIITSAGSERQMKAIAVQIQHKLAEKGIYAAGKEGLSNPSWIILDYSDVMVHIFKNEERHFYDLERIWQDAPRENVENF